jgi:hypothetical protein
MILGVRRGTAIAVFVAVAVAASLTSAFTSSITVSSDSVVYSKSHTVAVSDLVPASCSPLSGSLTGIRDGTSGSLIFGSGNASIWLWNQRNQTTTSGGTNLNGGSAADCMVPGGVRSGVTLTVGGGAGTDYCYDGPGPGTYTGNSCSNATFFHTPYLTVSTTNPAFS